MTTPLLGGLLAMATAALAGHRPMLRALYIFFALVLAVTALGIAVLFRLDALQMRRRSVRPSDASVAAAARYVFGADGAFLHGFAAHRILKRSHHRRWRARR